MTLLQSLAASYSEESHEYFFRCSFGDFRSFALLTLYKTHAMLLKVAVISSTSYRLLQLLLRVQCIFCLQDTRELLFSIVLMSNFHQNCMKKIFISSLYMTLHSKTKKNQPSAKYSQCTMFLTPYLFSSAFVNTEGFSG